MSGIALYAGRSSRTADYTLYDRSRSGGPHVHPRTVKQRPLTVCI